MAYQRRREDTGASMHIRREERLIKVFHCTMTLALLGGYSILLALMITA